MQLGGVAEDDSSSALAVTDGEAKLLSIEIERGVEVAHG